MRCGPKSVLACRLREESLRRQRRQLLARSTEGRAGWAGGPDSWCVLPVPCPPALAAGLRGTGDFPLTTQRDQLD